VYPARQNGQPAQLSLKEICIHESLYAYFITQENGLSVDISSFCCYQLHIGHFAVSLFKMRLIALS
jgi:hypothetical protein